MIQQIINLLDHMKVKKKLMTCFITVVIISSISGIAGAILLLNVDSQYSTALVINGFAQGEIGVFNTYLYQNSSLVRDVIFLNDADEVAKARTEMEEALKNTELALADIKLHCTTEEEKVFIRTIEENFPKYKQPLDQIIELGLQLKNDEALEKYQQESQPYLEATVAAAQALMELNEKMGFEVSESLTASSYITLIIIIAIIIIALLISIFVANLVAKLFATTIQEVNEATDKLENGDLNIHLESNAEDEIGDMARSFSRAAEMLKMYINEISSNLASVAAGNFDVHSTVHYKGDFIALKEAIDQITSGLSSTMYQINEASEQVTVGSVQLAENAQNLAEGATEQAGAVEELMATIQNVTAMVAESADKSVTAANNADSYADQAAVSNREMQALTEAMARISEVSKEIVNIITDIEDIASQTNLLSLNASIEAARAGEAGRGFAVVADEVRKLAEKTMTATGQVGEAIRGIQGGTAKNTENVEHSTQIVAEVMEMASRSGEALTEIVNLVDQAADQVRTIATASEEQSATSEEINRAIEDVSRISSETAAAMRQAGQAVEDLARQARTLDDLIAELKRG